MDTPSSPQVTQAVILAGGLGTRLRSVLSDRPKPMAVVDGKPLLEHQIVLLRSSGIRYITLCVGYMADVIESYFGDGSAWNIAVRYSRETDPLGTAGAIRHARCLLRDDTFLVLNGDTLIPGLDFADLIRNHRLHGTSRSTIGTLVVVAPPDTGAYGVLDMDQETLAIRGFREKAPVDPDSAVISGGAYVLEQSFFDFMTSEDPSSIEYDVFPAILQAGCHLWAYPHAGFFGDIGTPEGIDRVRRHLEARPGKETSYDLPK